MSFVSYEFIGFVFALIFLYFIIPMKVRCYVLLVGSVFFYYQSGWQRMIFLVVAALITYTSALAMGNLRETVRKKSMKDHREGAFVVLMISFLLLLSMLLYAKIGRQVAEAFGKILQGEGITASVIVPLGISYYTFAAVGYLADVYWKKDRPVSVFQERGVQIRKSVAAWPLPLRWLFYYGSIFAVLIFGVYGSGFNASSFVYMNY